jgi:hypothetical protein
MYPSTVRFALMAFPYPSSASPMIGKFGDTASHIRPPTSCISAYEINPTSGNAKCDAETQKPDIKAAEKPARSINRADNASCAHGACTMAGPLSSSRNAPAGSFFSLFFFDDGPPPPPDDDEEEDINAKRVFLRPYLLTAESSCWGELLRLEEEDENFVLLLDDDNDEGENGDKSREEDVNVMFFSLSLLYLSLYL